MRRVGLFVSVIAVLLTGTFGCAEKREVFDTDLLRLASWMTGSFSSQEQAAADSGFLDIRLEMVRIWKDRTDGVWLYVEQAAATALDRPYRQRVYRLSRLNEYILQSDVFTLENPLRFAGEWKNEAPLAHLTPDSLVEREGCFMHLRERGSEAFMGSTVGKGCRSTLGGASYATSEVTITEFDMTSWDRGFTEQNEQVWGAKTGPYVFKKMRNHE